METRKGVRLRPISLWPMTPKQARKALQAPPLPLHKIAAPNSKPMSANGQKRKRVNRK